MVGARFLFDRGVTARISSNMLLSRQERTCRYLFSFLKNMEHFGILECTPLDQLLTVGIEKDDTLGCLQTCNEI